MIVRSDRITVRIGTYTRRESFVDGKADGIYIYQLNPGTGELTYAATVAGAFNIPLPQLRARLGELPRDREILVICRSGQRAYHATRILLQNGFKARNISGGMLSRSHLAEGL